MITYQKFKHISLLSFLSEDTDNSEINLTSFDSKNILDRLKNQSKKQIGDYKNVTRFGLEDTDKRIVVVTVNDTEADQFEQTLKHHITDSDVEIAEVLHKLSRDYQIVDVSYGSVEEDEEPIIEQPTEDAEETKPEEDADGEESTELEDSTEPVDSDNKDILTKVIDMMMADADARKKEFAAREKEAEANITRLSTVAAQEQAAQEQEVTTMNNYYKNKRQEDKTIATQAKLAQFKQDVSSGDIDLNEATRQVRRSSGSNKVKTGFRCTSGPRKGRMVSNPSSCAGVIDQNKRRTAKRTMRAKKSIIFSKSRRTKHQGLSRQITRLNKRLSGRK